MKKVGERAHSKFSASGAERWFQCSGSVTLSEGMPDKSSDAAKEGTLAHEVLEAILKKYTDNRIPEFRDFKYPVTHEMFDHGVHAANQIMEIFEAAKDDYADLMVESRVTLDFIHPEAFGSLDAAVLDYFGTLHILDYKYGFTLVSPVKNLQFIFYSLAVADYHSWNFKRVRMWTLQPRVKGFDGYQFWDISMDELKAYIPEFKRAVERVEKFPTTYNEGKWCYFCKAKSKCPLKVESRLQKGIEIFKADAVKAIDSESSNDLDFF